MAFVFSTSHLPETRVRRPDDDADDDDDDGIMPPPPRSGGVRAFSHLPPRDCDDGTAPSHAGAHCHGGRQDPEGMAKIIIDDASPLFGQMVRRALRAEAGESPAAAALLRHVGTLPNRITVRRRTGGLACTRTDADGNVTIHLNPHEMTDATFSHELGHVLQQAHTHGALQRIRATGRTPTNADLEDAIDAARDALDAIVRVKDERDADTEHKENEAMRISNIVNAERTATGMLGLPEALRTEEEFWARQRPRQTRDRHQDNEQPMPPGSHYGTHPLGHVRRVFGG